MAGTSGWWQCSLYGRHGLAPANRLQLLPLPAATAGTMSPVALRHGLAHATSDVQNIYQIPSVPRLSSSPTYECMDRICKTSPTEAREGIKVQHVCFSALFICNLFPYFLISLSGTLQHTLVKCYREQMNGAVSQSIPPRSTVVHILGKCY